MKTERDLRINYWALDGRLSRTQIVRLVDSTKPGFGESLFIINYHMRAIGNSLLADTRVPKLLDWVSRKLK